MEAYTARADEREEAAREIERLRAKEFERARTADRERMDRVELRLDKIEASIVSLKRFIVGASLSTVLGVGAFNAALIQNYHAAFDSARHLTATQQDFTAQRQRTEALLTAMDKGGQRTLPR